MRISVVTVCFNSVKTIADTLRSVALQSHPDVEHIIVDGASTDGTIERVRTTASLGIRVVSEPDEGIYDAMNKGLALASGDVVAFLNSDDCYVDANVLSDVAAAFEAGDPDLVYGDISMVNANGEMVRYWRTGVVPDGGLRASQIPHPALFVRKRVLNTVSPAFDPKYRIASDLKQQLILINQRGARGVYVPRPLVTMRIGGASTGDLSGYVTGWKESARAYNEVFGAGGAWYTVRKVLSKFRGLRKLR
jgi:glycosyltransferase